LRNHPRLLAVVFSSPPVNLMNSTTVLEIGELACRIEEAQDLAVVVFASANHAVRYLSVDTAIQRPAA
jgi:hypothetical protein